MKIKRMIHGGWKEWQNQMPKSVEVVSMFGKEGWAGKYQYICSSEKGEISLVKLKIGGLNKPIWMWEITSKCFRSDSVREPSMRWTW